MSGLTPDWPPLACYTAEPIKARSAWLTIADRFNLRRLVAASAFFSRSFSTSTEMTFTPLPILGAASQ